MALKFLNKKGWHTGSLRNIENVWKAEQKHDAEQKKLEELRKQIQEERERSEFRLLQEQAGLIPKQERLDFLYDSGLAVGKGSSSLDGFKSVEESVPKSEPDHKSASSSTKPSVPGALFEEKPQSANDAWRKLHSDPLLLIRQREQEALARVKNNPIQMAMIRKSVEAKKHKEKTPDVKEHGKKNKKSKHQKHSSTRHHFESSHAAAEGEGRSTINHKRAKYDEHLTETFPNSENESSEDIRRKRNSYKDLKYKEHSAAGKNEGRPKTYDPRGWMDSESARKGGRVSNPAKQSNSSDTVSRYESQSKRRNNAVELSQEERAAKLHEMQMDAELHEEQRWKRLKKAEEEDNREATRAHTSGSRNFLDATTRSVYGAEKGGSSTIEESVRRRTHYLQGRSQVGEGNAFRR